MKTIELIQTGGTIAMSLDRDGMALDPERWTQTLYSEIPELGEIAGIEVSKLFFEDSSDLNPTHWETIARHIHARRGMVDGFVILHGTDTMAFTASALAFVLQGLDTPVILTGSQVPLSTIRSDARRNLVNAVEMATQDLPEVCICFNDTLYRGCRTTKMSIGDFNAFESPNFPPLVRIGLSFERIPEAQRTSGWNDAHRFLGRTLMTSSDSKTHPNSSLFSSRVFVLPLFPGLSPSILANLPLGEFDAIIIQAYGSGNFPTIASHSLLPQMNTWLNEGVKVIISSQAPYDAVNLDAYASGRRALEMGAISAGDMTLEAATAKAMLLLGSEQGNAHFTEAFVTPWVGERSGS